MEPPEARHAPIDPTLARHAPIDPTLARRSPRDATIAQFSPYDALALAALLLLATAIRVHDLSLGGLWLDEGYSLLQSERSFADILALRRYDANPPLYLLLLHGWRALFGPSVLAAQAFSVAFGVAGVGLVWLVTRQRFGRVAALAAGLAVALSRFHVHYSQEIRGYALLFALVAAADLAYVRWEVGGRRRDLVAWTLAAIAAIATHTFAWWVIGVHVLLAARRRALLAALAVVILASVPLWLTLWQHLTTFRTQSWIGEPDATGLAHALWVLGGCGPIAWVTWSLAALGFAAQVAPRLPSLLTRDAALPGWRTVVVPAAQLALPFVVFVLSLVATPMLVERYLLPSLLPLAGLVGAGVAALRIPAARATLIVALVVLSIPPLRDESATMARTDVSREIAALLAAVYGPAAAVIYTSKFDFVPMVAQHTESMEEYLLPEIAGSEYSTVLLDYTTRRVRRDVPARGEYRRLWLVRRAVDRPEDVAASDWFRTLDPTLAWQHPSGLLLRFDLPQ